ncbi:methylmalonyl Co-A mutase-associated GTPase MeaB [Nakamurella flavida]|uniref:Methylmalonyl Co-A mutase-associated GTPase MeaB n=1 Tax=Nakamurella flavida TaxID=363630 RepID=A0A938YS40_9ACTN|nr:methylmalonyl Co-A mutase-associated GTPase MeaB [Nakamurella flavida]MBM9478459.1 methylmalonyl Co-A mutase-associated GTPase MeaB [Nakamurella flavida]MDP9777715.1 LAO/AO transport system kinase [Nakamurella flavida]
MSPADLDPAVLAAQVRLGSRAALARAVTLVESTRPDHRRSARTLMAALAPASRPDSVRVGISGVPGVGKSTLVERLGMELIDRGHRVGVLAVDPSSRRTGGSVLGDKTRMPRLAADPAAYVRPSPTAGTLGGVTRATAQTIGLLEAAGHDVVLVETVGVGQSETAVAGMVDTFLLLTLARSGDHLQGIKKGVLELADVLAVTKADEGHERVAASAARELAGALRLVRGGDRWEPPVLTCSGLTGAGLDELWQAVLDHRAAVGNTARAERRAAQRWELTETLVREEVLRRFDRHGGVAAARAAVQAQVLGGELTPAAAADALLAVFDGPDDEL